jgi:transposase/IS5 family transposase
MASAKEATMRGTKDRQAEMLLGVTADQLVPGDHPIRRIRTVVERVLAELSPRFDAMYATIGRPSVPPEHLLKASLLMALYSVPSERQFCERLRYDLLFKWFLDLNIADEPFNPTTFTKNRERLLAQDIAAAFLGEVVREARRRRLISEDHFSVDGTLLQAWASHKSYRPRDDDPGSPGRGRNTEVDFKGERRSRETHVSRTDPEALLFKKANSEAARLSYIGHALVENRNGLVVDVALSQATSRAEREMALTFIDRLPGHGRGRTLGADKGYHTYALEQALAERGVVAHLAWNDGLRRRPLPEALGRDEGYQLSQRRRKVVEEVFGWMKTVACTRKLRYVGQVRNELWLTLTAVAYNLVRMASLEPQPA